MKFSVKDFFIFYAVLFYNISIEANENQKAIRANLGTWS